MTPADEETTIGQAQERITAALGRSHCVNVCRHGRLWPRDRRWSAWVVVHTGGDDGDGHVVRAVAGSLGAAIAEVVRGAERHAGHLSALLGGAPLSDATGADHAQAAALDGGDA